MPILERLLKFLDNASVGAFLGAAFAFVLVIANDWRRERKKARSLIPVLLRHARELIASRETGAANVRASLGHSEVARNTGLRFATVRLERLAEECADQLHDRNQMALQNLAFWMDSADGLNAEALRLVDQIEEGIASPVTEKTARECIFPPSQRSSTRPMVRKSIFSGGSRP